MPRRILCVLLLLISVWAGAQTAGHEYPQYQLIQDNLARGWNTWNTRSVLSHVLLPEGFAVNLAFKQHYWLNEQYLGYCGTTDCLSFDLSDDGDVGRDRVFDVIVNGELALREAARRGHAGAAELALYITHGLLHNLGFDDATPQQAREMHRRENEILQHLGYGLVYDDDGPVQ